MNYRDCFGRIIIPNHYQKHGLCNPFSYGSFEIGNISFKCSGVKTQKQLFCACILGPYRNYKVKINACPNALNLPYIMGVLSEYGNMVVTSDLDERILKMYVDYRIHFPTVKPSDFLLYNWADEYYYMNFKRDLKDLHELFPSLF